jgi:hypothetical protein
MYEFVDRPVTSLDKGCRFLIWSMRSWILVASHKECPGQTLAPAFAQWKMIGGLQPFLRLMITLNRDSLDKVQFCSLNCNRVSEHEAVLLSLFVELADGDRIRSRDTISLLVSDEAVGDLLNAVTGLSNSLRHAEIEPRRPDHARL